MGGVRTVVAELLRAIDREEGVPMKSVAVVLAAFLVAGPALAQGSTGPAAVTAPTAREHEIQELRAELARISARLDALEQSGSASDAVATAAADEPTTAASAEPPEPALPVAAVSAAPPVATVQTQQPSPSPLAGVLPANLPGGATLNYTFDGYYEYNFNRPPGRANQLRAYDVLSNAFSINQADIILDLDPDVEKGRRYGLRLDLQFGQATATLQGNPANEPRPSIYANIYQAYGSYVLPVGKGLQVDFGKWASSLGAEGNYTKDQMNYTRFFNFYYLPFYHEGFRASYHFNDKFAVNYWLVNGVNQTEPTNGFKDELFGFVLSPAKSVTWTSNYYFGQENPDSVSATNCTYLLQPGLCLKPIIPTPDGKLHILNNYATWQVNPKLTLMGEGDYVIQRTWANAAPGQSSAPSHVSGGTVWLQYQVDPRTWIAGRAEYLSDRNGLFSGASQALKEATVSYKRQVGDGLDAFIEFRRDWSNVPYFQTHNAGGPSEHQDTATLGLVWWYGGKQGSW